MTAPMAIILFALYIVTSKAYLLDKARADVRLEYNIGNTGQKIYILAMLPIMYMKGL